MIYSVIVEVGLDTLLTLSVFAVDCALALALQLFGTMSLWLRLLAKRSPLQLFSQISPVLVTAFSTVRAVPPCPPRWRSRTTS